MEEKSGLSLNLSYCGNSTRYVILIVSILALSFVLANTLALNFTVICMYKDAPPPTYQNSTENLQVDRELLYSVNQQSWLFSATAIGNIFGTLPLPYSTNNFGVRKTFTFYGFISGFSTLILPFLVSFGFPFVFLIRIIQGFGVAISFTALGAIVSSWSTIKGSGTYIAILSCHFQTGAIMAMVIGGEFCSNSYGWTKTYYILGIGTLLSFILFFFFYRDTPSIHKNVSDKELTTISKGKVPLTKAQHKIPYKAILTDLPVIGIIVSCFGACFGVQTLFQYGPIYLNKVLGFDAQKTGIAAALPFVLSIAVKFVVGPFSNLFTFLSERGKIIFFNSLSQIPMCLCFLSMAILPANMIWLIQIAYSLVNAFAGLGAVGISKSVTLVSAHHSHFVMTFCSFINSLVILTLPFFISTLAPDNSSEQWSRIFWTLTIFVFITLMFFNFTARASPRPWTMNPPPSSQVADETQQTRRYSIDSFIVRL